MLRAEHSALFSAIRNLLSKQLVHVLTYNVPYVCVLRLTAVSRTLRIPSTFKTSLIFLEGTPLQSVRFSMCLLETFISNYVITSNLNSSSANHLSAFLAVCTKKCSNLFSKRGIILETLSYSCWKIFGASTEGLERLTLWQAIPFRPPLNHHSW